MARRALGDAQLALVQAVAPVLRDHPGELVVGCSGGADSLALAATLAHLDAERVTAVVIDHGLQHDSKGQARQVARWVAGLGIRAEVRCVEVRPDGQGLEAAARTARLRALVGDAKAPVLLGHTLDDQAEGVLLGLARGSGAASLQAMAARQPWEGGMLLRPLLGLRREVTRRACEQWGLEPWQDPMNDDPRFLRVRVRHELLPVMGDVLGPGVVEALGRTASLAREDNDLLERLAVDSQRDLVRGDALDAPALLHLHPALRGRVLRRWLRDRGCAAPTMQHIRAVAALAEDWHGQAGVDLPGNITVRRREGVLVAGSTSAG